MNIDTTAGHAVESRTLGPDQIKAAARRVLEEIFPSNDEAALREVVTQDFVNHEAPPGVPPGPDSVIVFMRLLDRAFSDQRWDIEKVISEGDTVAIYCRHSGRHTGDFFGLPATGRAFDYRQMHLIRMRGDRGAEHWAVRDDAALHRQLTGESR
jgi:ketosteroid isomerase-like protein